jgi:aminoglycoside phosphotransferase (APT) family kinase protein
VFKRKVGIESFACCFFSWFFLERTISELTLLLGISARGEITAKMQRKIVRAKEGRYSGGDFISCIEQMDLLKKYWIPELDHAPRVLVHGDLSPNNIIVDEHYDVQGFVIQTWKRWDIC